jgi:hypothetical protein
MPGAQASTPENGHCSLNPVQASEAANADRREQLTHVPKQPHGLCPTDALLRVGFSRPVGYPSFRSRQIT